MGVLLDAEGRIASDLAAGAQAVFALARSSLTAQSDRKPLCLRTPQLFMGSLSANLVTILIKVEYEFPHVISCPLAASDSERVS